MTYPSAGFSNNWGFYDPTVSYQPPLGSGVPPATGAITVPQSPSGAISSEAPPFQYSTGIMVTESFLTDVLGVDSDQEGLPALTAPVSLSGLAPVQIQQNSWQSSCVADVLS
jgi:hypothetical protein